MQIMRNVYSGAVLEQEIRCVPDGITAPKNFEQKPRFDNDEDREAHRTKISEKNFIRKINNNFTPAGFYSTNTQDDDHEVHTLEEFDEYCRKFKKSLRKINPEVKIVIVTGRGKGTNRIHAHTIVEGISEEDFRKAWKWGKVTHFEQLREHNYYDGEDHGADFTQLAKYLHRHWTPEQRRRRRWMQTRNVTAPEPEEPQVVDTKVPYTAKRPPKTPKGYKRVEARATEYGYLYFKYVRDVDKKKRE